MSNLRDLRKKLRERLRQRPATGGSFLPPAGGPAGGAAAGGSGAPGPDAEDSFLPPVAGRSTAPRRRLDVIESAGGVPLPDVNPHPAGGPFDELRAGSADLSLPGEGLLPPLSLALALPGEVRSNPWGDYWRHCPAVDGGQLAVPATARGKLGELGRIAPERVLVLDLETCGLRDAPLFLVGLADGAGAVELLLARQLAEEPAVVQAAAERLAAAEAVVTFNGLTFDVPFLTARARYFGIDLTWPPLHVDLLPLARRRYGKRFGNCKLVTLEAAVLGRQRPGEDIPSAEIPAVYQRFTESGDGRLLQPIAWHNALDLVASLGLASVG